MRDPSLVEVVWASNELELKLPSPLDDGSCQQQPHPDPLRSMLCRRTRYRQDGFGFYTSGTTALTGNPGCGEGVQARRSVRRVTARCGCGIWSGVVRWRRCTHTTISRVWRDAVWVARSLWAPRRAHWPSGACSACPDPTTSNPILTPDWTLGDGRQHKGGLTPLTHP